MQALQIVISGMAQGCIYGLIALGLVLIYKATETVSFAQGELMMLGAFAGFALMTLLGWPFWLADAGDDRGDGAVRLRPRAHRHPADPRPAGVLDRHADDRHRLRGARPRSR